VVEGAKFAPLGKRGMFTSRQGFGVGDYLKTANDQSLLIVLIEDIVAVNNLDAILTVDHIDVFFVAPNDLATSMGHIGNMTHPEVQKTVDGAIAKIVQARRTAGTLVSSENVEGYTWVGVRCIMTSFFRGSRPARRAAGPRGRGGRLAPVRVRPEADPRPREPAAHADGRAVGVQQAAPSRVPSAAKATAFILRDARDGSTGVQRGDRIPIAVGISCSISRSGPWVQIRGAPTVSCSVMPWSIRLTTA
jgi:hypothetical protein